MTTIEVALYSVALILFPLAVYSLFNGSPTPPNFGRLSKYYDAERLLRPAGDVLLLALSVNAGAKLADHFGFLSPGWMANVEPVANGTFLLVLVFDLALWVRAYRKVHRMPVV